MSDIDVRDVTVMAGERALVRDISLRVKAGTWTTVIGPNGAGKTTLIETVAAVRTAQSGTIRIDNETIHELSERARARRIAFVPQHPEAPSGMTVREYVSLGRTAHRGLVTGVDPNENSVVDSTLERLGLSSLTRRDVATLSGGERQRAVIARALSQEASVLVLDEPTTGLDLRHQIEILELLRHEVDGHGLCALATMHDLTLAGQFADRLALIDGGCLVAEGPSHDIVRSSELERVFGIALRVLDVDGSDVVVPTRLTINGSNAH